MYNKNRMSYLELLAKLHMFPVGKKFRKFNKGERTHSYIVVTEVTYPDGTSGLALQWESGNHVHYNPGFIDFTFEEELDCVKIDIIEALKLILDDNTPVYSEDSDGEMVRIDMDDDFKWIFDIETFGDLLKRTDFYIKE